MTRSNALIRTLENAAMKGVLAFIRLRERNRAKPPEPEGRQRVLVCKWCCMGDAIVSLYAIREFKRRHPEIVLDMLVSSRIAEVYRRAPEIRGVHVLPITGRRLILELLNPGLWSRLAALLIRLRRNRYSQFIDLELYRGTGPVLKRLIGIPYSRGFQVEGALPKYHDFEVPLPRHMPEWQCFYRVLGMEIPGSLPDALYPKAIESGPEPVAKGRRIGVVFGSSFNWPQKKWPWEKYAELITLMSPEGHEFILLGAPDEKEEGGRIAAMAKGKVKDITGTLDFQALQREVAACDLVVGNDTGTMHLAAACDVPTVTLFGPTDPGKWNPLTSTPVFLEDVPCRPCYYLGSMPPCSHFSCLRKMEPALVADKIRRVLASRGRHGYN
ncbi:MAG: lipopolysaccharide heptosyltransferase [Fibrobacteres bacterium]|nr:lipopolysaccharide heptosyltransferase [Fibrobacterota bacterium]